LLLQFYIMDGQPLASPSPFEEVRALAKGDDGKPLFSVSDAVIGEDGGVALEVIQDERLGWSARLPQLEFLNKNTKFRSDGRAYKSFKFFARAVRCEAGKKPVVLAQAESEAFKVCRNL